MVCLVALAALAGCATPEERRIAAIEGEMRDYVSQDVERLEEIEARYADAEDRVRELRKVEVAQATRFRDDLLERVRASRTSIVRESLERQLEATERPEARLRLRAQTDRLEALYHDLEDSVDRTTAAIVDVRAGARDEQVARLEREKAERRRALEERRRAFVGERQSRIAAIRAGLPETASGAARAVPAAAAPGGAADGPVDAAGAGEAAKEVLDTAPPATRGSAEHPVNPPPKTAEVSRGEQEEKPRR